MLGIGIEANGRRIAFFFDKRRKKRRKGRWSEVEAERKRREIAAMVPRRISGGNIDRLGFGCGVTLE